MILSVSPRRRWYQFRLRTLLVIAAFLVIPFAWVAHELTVRRREKRVDEWLLKEFASVYDRDLYISEGLQPRFQESWLERMSNASFGPRVWSVDLSKHGVLKPDVSDVSRLVDLTHLRQLFLDAQEIRDITPLAELERLHALTLDDTPVSDISPLADLRKLRWLSLSGTPVRDLTPLTGMKNLEHLWLDDTHVSDLTPLAGLTKLQVLGLTGTTVSEEQVQTLHEALPECDIRR
ncbi:MAG: leucine-rich repeat domain-containing protein [Planctomycetota bacterium]|nr:MAG: leucine-rich repeat domain-containing protein [Planctomycetota bacterium]REJ95686.1 MAG: leucine-rich repeat domain-containing protein [Planctomycetota bacterium]REK29198.1 MAG: leucine-rich repeat domain-containing protein [Planctomycetota bacterium]REK46987.1 MAG: leucine-rich repeat domain-containing protein [Planctomycetota bacterium]